MAITHIGHTWLLNYIRDAAALGGAPKGTAKKAVVLTAAQQAGLTGLLRALWNEQYQCPAILDIKPQHGYRSRVFKDSYLPEDFVEWLVAGCSDVAEVGSQEETGRPMLIVRGVQGRWAKPFDIIVPVRSDALGYVHIDDVIPKGLPPRQKKAAP